MLTVPRFHEKLVASNILLRMSDIEKIVKEVQSSNPSVSDIVRYQVAYEKAVELYVQVSPLRMVKGTYLDKWDGVNKRKAC